LTFVSTDQNRIVHFSVPTLFNVTLTFDSASSNTWVLTIPAILLYLPLNSPILLLLPFLLSYQVVHSHLDRVPQKAPRQALTSELQGPRRAANPVEVAFLGQVRDLFQSIKQQQSLDTYREILLYLPHTQHLSSGSCIVVAMEDYLFRHYVDQCRVVKEETSYIQVFNYSVCLEWTL
jgi:hypothetical protein